MKALKLLDIITPANKKKLIEGLRSTNFPYCIDDVIIIKNNIEIIFNDYNSNYFFIKYGKAYDLLSFKDF